MKKFKGLFLVAAGVSFVWGPIPSANAHSEALSNRPLRAQRLQQRLEQRALRGGATGGASFATLNSPASSPQFTRGWRQIEASSPRQNRVAQLDLGLIPDNLNLRSMRQNFVNTQLVER